MKKNPTTMLKKFGFSLCCEYTSPQEITIQIELINSKTLINETSAITFIGSGIGTNASGGYHNSNQLFDNNPLNISLYYFYIFVDIDQGQIDETKDFLYIIEDQANIPLYLNECDQKMM